MKQVMLAVRLAHAGSDSNKPELLLSLSACFPLQTIAVTFSCKCASQTASCAAIERCRRFRSSLRLSNMKISESGVVANELARWLLTGKCECCSNAPSGLVATTVQDHWAFVSRHPAPESASLQEVHPADCLAEHKASYPENRSACRTSLQASLPNPWFRLSIPTKGLALERLYL